MSSSELLLQIVQHSFCSSINYCTNFRKKKQAVQNEEKKESVNPWLLRKIFKFYETLLAEQRLEDKHNYKIILRMTSETFEETFRLIKIDTTKEKTKMRELILPIS